MLRRPTFDYPHRRPTFEWISPRPPFRPKRRPPPPLPVAPAGPPSRRCASGGPSPGGRPETAPGCVGPGEGREVGRPCGRAGARTASRARGGCRRRSSRHADARGGQTQAAGRRPGTVGMEGRRGRGPAVCPVSLLARTDGRVRERERERERARALCVSTGASTCAHTGVLETAEVSRCGHAPGPMVPASFSGPAAFSVPGPWPAAGGATRRHEYTDCDRISEMDRDCGSDQSRPPLCHEFAGKQDRPAVGVTDSDRDSISDSGARPGGTYTQSPLSTWDLAIAGGRALCIEAGVWRPRARQPWPGPAPAAAEVGELWNEGPQSRKF